ncbi:MAG: hypothetical protein K6G40_00305 [Eubacterium sp.]|nr:hypothetical protein [Eubacterium sp.]
MIATNISFNGIIASADTETTEPGSGETQDSSEGGSSGGNEEEGSSGGSEEEGSNDGSEEEGSSDGSNEDGSNEGDEEPKVTYVAEYNGVQYEKVDDAISAALSAGGEATVTLLADCSLESGWLYIAQGINLTIDGGGGKQYIIY